jgi:hypothetical protein
MEVRGALSTLEWCCGCVVVGLRKAGLGLTKGDVGLT